MTLTKFPRPCPIPGHPQDDARRRRWSPDSAWSRLRAWHLHAPAERLPLPLALVTWPAAWVLHAVHVPGRVVTYAAAGAVAGHLADVAAARQDFPAPAPGRHRGRHGRRGDRRVDRRGCHVRAAGLARAPAELDLPGRRRLAATGGCAGTRPSAPPASAGTTHAAWTARKAEWHRIAHLIGLGDFHLQSVTPTRLGEELLLTSAPGSELATRVAANSRPYAEKYAHLRGLPYGRVDIRTHRVPRPAGHRGPGEGPVGQRPGHPPGARPGLAVQGLVPRAPQHPRRRSRSGSSPRPASRWNWSCGTSEGGKAVGVYCMTGGGKTNMLDVHPRMGHRDGRRRPGPAERGRAAATSCPGNRWPP